MRIILFYCRITEKRSSRAVLALLRISPRSRLKQSRQLLPILYSDFEKTTSRFRLHRPRSRPCKKSKHAANATATVPSGVRCDKKTCHRFYFVPLSSFLHPLLGSSSAARAETRRSARKMKEQGEKTSLRGTGNLVIRTRAGERRVGLLYFGQTGQPVSFTNITPDGSRACGTNVFLFSPTFPTRPKIFSQRKMLAYCVYTVAPSRNYISQIFLDYTIFLTIRA